jgi:hypothetical protein
MTFFPRPLIHVFFFSLLRGNNQTISYIREGRVCHAEDAEEIDRYEIIVVFCGGWSGTHAVTMVHHS